MHSALAAWLLQDESEWMQRTQAIRSELETLRGVAAASDTQARQALTEAQQSRRDAELLRQERALLVQQAVTLQQERNQLEVGHILPLMLKVCCARKVSHRNSSTLKQLELTDRPLPQSAQVHCP